MRILILSELWHPFPGGAERFAHNIGRGLAAMGHEVQVLTSYARNAGGNVPGFPFTERYLGMTIEHIHVPVRELHEQGAAKIREALRHMRPEVIITHQFFAQEFRQELEASTIPVVQIVYNCARYPEAGLAIFISEHTLRFKLGVARDDAQPQDIVVHPSALDDVVAKRTGDAVGFIKPIAHKGADFVYALAQQSPKRRFLILRGEWQDVEIIRALPNVEFMQPVADVSEFYAQIRILLVPSLYEDAGTVPLEAAANGIACISSDVMGLPEINAGGIVLPLDERKWISEIEKLDDPEYYDGITARQRAHLASLDFNASMRRLDLALRKLKYVSRYRGYPAIGREWLTTYPTQADREWFLLGHAAGRILDIGCNDCGLWQDYPLRQDIYGVDLSQQAIWEAVGRGFKAVLARGESTPFDDCAFDTVAISEILEHVESPEALLGEAVRVCRDGGRIIGTVPSPRGGWGEGKFDPDHVRYWQAEDLETLLAKFGRPQVREINADFLAFTLSPEQRAVARE